MTLTPEQLYGGRIGAMRTLKGWSQTELAKRLGVSRGRVAHLEAGRRPIDLRMILKLGKVFLCRPGTLVDLTDAEGRP